MNQQKNIAEQLKEKLWKIHTVTDLRDMVFQSAERYSSKAAFDLRDASGKRYPVSYLQVKEDVISLGTAMMHAGLTGKAIAVMRKK